MRPKFFLLVIAFLPCVLAVTTLAQIGSRPADQWIPMLESPGRVENLRVSEVIAALHLKPGNMVADIGAGSGVFSRPLAAAIRPGILYAVDIDAQLLAHIERTCKEQQIDNVRTVLAATDDPRLPVKVDLIFLCDTLHHIGGPAAYLKNLPRYLSKGGRIAVIDFKENWPPGHESMQFTTTQLQEWMKRAGLVKVEDLNIPKNAFFHIYSASK